MTNRPKHDFPVLGFLQLLRNGVRILVEACQQSRVDPRLWEERQLQRESGIG